jgi:VIT1/CCC1 family predicted Fe2+/Mn2+ transporter
MSQHTDILTCKKMESRPARDSRAYRTAAALFATGGLLFITVSVVSGKIGVFLPVGIALVIISIGFLAT